MIRPFEIKEGRGPFCFCELLSSGVANCCCCCMGTGCCGRRRLPRPGRELPEVDWLGSLEIDAPPGGVINLGMGDICGWLMLLEEDDDIETDVVWGSRGTVGSDI